LDDTKSNRPTTGIDLCQKAYTQNKTTRLKYLRLRFSRGHGRRWAISGHGHS